MAVSGQSGKRRRGQDRVGDTGEAAAREMSADAVAVLGAREASIPDESGAPVASVFDAAHPELTRFRVFPAQIAWGPHLTNLACCVSFDNSGNVRGFWSAKDDSRLFDLISWSRPDADLDDERITLATAEVVREAVFADHGALTIQSLVPRGAEGGELEQALLMRCTVARSGPVRVLLKDERNTIAVIDCERQRATLNVGGRRVMIFWTGEASLRPLSGETHLPASLTLDWDRIADGEQVDVRIEYEMVEREPAAEFADQADATLEKTWRFFADALADCHVIAPDEAVIEAAIWARVNILRSVFDFPLGLGFSNDITLDYLVSRDTSWMAMGLVYFIPEWSKDLLRVFHQRCRENGLMVEYVRAIDGRTETYDMDILDNNPLHIIASEHVARITHDAAFADESYPVCALCGSYILGRRDGDGLVSLRAVGQGTHGISSWRNIIPGYRLDGAVTEINAECYAALRAVGRLAEQTGRQEEAGAWFAAAEELKESMNRILRKPNSTTYVRNRDPDGRLHSSRTGDEVFPILFGVSEAEGTESGIRLLRDEDLSARGVRTIPTTEPEYHPTAGFGLLGGVWPDLTLWWARAALSRGSVEEALDLFRRTVSVLWEGARANAVPGQFPEYFCGASGVNRGMYLSPWVAPKVLWLLVDGFLGLDAEGERLRVTPRLPAQWAWAAIENLSILGEKATIWMLRERQEIYVAGLPLKRVATGGGWKIRPVRADRSQDLSRSNEKVVAKLFEIDADSTETHLIVANTSQSIESCALSAGSFDTTLTLEPGSVAVLRAPIAPGSSPASGKE